MPEGPLKKFINTYAMHVLTYNEEFAEAVVLPHVPEQLRHQVQEWGTNIAIIKQQEKDTSE